MYACLPRHFAPGGPHLTPTAALYRLELVGKLQRNSLGAVLSLCSVQEWA